MGEMWFRVRDFFGYTKHERRDLIISILVIAFVFGYDDKSESFNIAYWGWHFILVLIIVAVAFFVHTGVQKVAALHQGFMAEYRAWHIGLAISAVVTLISGGRWFVVLPGSVFLIHNPTLRLGKWRYGTNVAAQGMVAAVGPVGNLVLATISLALGAQLGIMPAAFGLAASINFWILFYTLLPLPHLDGIRLFFMSRLVYVFIASTLLSYVILASFGFYSWVISFLIGVVCWLLFYLFYERGV